MEKIKNIYNIIIFITFLSIFFLDIFSFIYFSLDKIVATSLWMDILDILSFLSSFTGKIGTIFWFFSYMFFIIFAIRSALFIIKNIFTVGQSYSQKVKTEDKKLFHRYCPRISLLVTPLVIAVWFIIIFINMYYPKNLYFETPQEINQTINLLTQSDDMGYRGSIHWGYPARECFLPSLPSIIFGRNLFNLHFGGSLYFFIAILIFSYGILITFNNKASGGLICAIILSLMFHAYYINFWVFYFEHSLFPFAFTLIFCGLFLHYLKDRTDESLLLMAFSLLYLIFTYTNGLAVYFLAISVLIYVYIKMDIPKKQKILIILIIIITLASFFMSLKFRNDIHIVANRDQTNNNINFLSSTMERLGFTFEHFILDIHLLPNVSSVFNGLFLSVIFCSLCFVFGWEMSVIAFWIICTIIFSVISKGTSYYPPELAIQRASVIFPVLFLMLIKIIKSINFEFKKFHYLLFILFIFTFITGLCYQQNFLSRRENDDYYRRRQYNLITWLKINLTDKDLFYYKITEKTLEEAKCISRNEIYSLVNKEFTGDILRKKLKRINLNPREIDNLLRFSRYNRKLIFYFDVNLNQQYVSIKDLTQYFFPDFYHTILDDDCKQLSSPESGAGFLFATKGQLRRKDYDDIKHNLEYINTFRFRTDEALDLYRFK